MVLPWRVGRKKKGTQINRLNGKEGANKWGKGETDEGAEGLVSLVVSKSLTEGSLCGKETTEEEQQDGITSERETRHKGK